MINRAILSSSLMALFTIQHFTVQARGCLPLCSCKWKNGKITVECVEKDMTYIPNSLDPETQVLDFSGNNLQVLQKEAFKKSDLVNLQKIYLQNCRLHKVDNEAFKGLTNLVELDLSQNFLTLIPSSNFNFFPSLMRLLLNNNLITTVAAHTFQHLPFLNTLEISNCKIDLIENDAFSGLNHLEWLRLNGNKLKTIRGDSILPETLKGIDLHNNDWNCDCEMRDLYTWIKNFNLPHSVDPVCTYPERLRNKIITTVNEIDLACVPETQPKTIFLDITEGKNITLECQVTSVPEASVSWWFQGQVLQNDTEISPGLHLVYYIEEGALDKKSELYIFNTNSADNGTYSCVAENPAGKSQSNYTIRIVLREEPVIVVAPFSHKYLIILTTAGLFVVSLIFAIVTIAVIKCRADTRNRKKKESGKDVALHDQNGCSSRENTTPRSETMLPKANGSLVIGAQTHSFVRYPVHVPRDFIMNVNTDRFYAQRMFRSPTEKNPDLIHDTESVAKKGEGCGLTSSYEATNPMSDTFEEGSVMSLPVTLPRQVTWQDQQGCQNVRTFSREAPANLYQHSADIHLSPGCFLDDDGYPKDYGLPKLPCRLVSTANINFSKGLFCQTLPHKRSMAHRTQLNYAKDNEFNPKSGHNHELYNGSDIRYTAEGYPFARSRPQVSFTDKNNVVYTDCSFVPSPPEGYKSENLTQCCITTPTERCSMWAGNATGTCTLPRSKLSLERTLNASHSIETKCANTQTSDTDAKPGCENHKNNLKPLASVETLKRDLENCSESPDEGYVGDGVEATDI